MKISRGNPEQLRKAVNRQIAKLQGVEECSDITSSTDVSSLEDMTEGELLVYLHDWFGDDVDFMDFEDDVRNQYSEDVAQGAFSGTFDAFLRDWCKEGLDQGFTINFADVNTRRDEVNDFLNASTKITASQFPVEDVLDFLASKGYDTSTFEVKSYAEGVANYMDMSREAYEHEDMEWPYTLDQWYKDTQQNYPDDLAELPTIDAACNSANIMAADLDEESQMVWDVAQDFSGYTYPITDSWNHDTLLEMGAIAKKLDCSLEEAADKMVDILGFEPEDVDIDKLAGGADVQQLLSKYLDDVVEGASSNDPYTKDVDEVTYDVVEADTDADESDTESDDYIKALEEKLDKWSKDSDTSKTIASMILEHDSSALYASVTTQDSTIYSYTVPYDDLSFNDENIDKDMDYIINTISDDLDAKSEEEPEEESTKITASYDEDYSTNWERLAGKSVPDSDGFYTDYTLYKYLGDLSDVDDDIYICMFGDTDLYPPSFDYADWSGSSEAEAYEWFESYTGFDDEDYDDIEY